jgi:hypothetical protein
MFNCFLQNSDMLGPLMAGCIAGAGLTLAGGQFLKDCTKIHIRRAVGRPVPIYIYDALLRPLLIDTLLTVLLFVTSALVLSFYVFLGDKVYLCESFIMFLTAIIFFAYNCIAYGLFKI